MSEEHTGADNNQRLLAAARDDNEELLQEVFEKGGFDINFQDGLGNTALHYAASHGSTDILESLLTHEECDVDPINRLEGATPLHLAIRLEDKDTRKYVVESLLDAGADTRIKDKNGETVLDLLTADDEDIKILIRKSQAQSAVSMDDVVSDDDGVPGSGSGSGSDDD
ncbi:ankyrin [Dentipellis sp. KUC8613]|nr:ankyrin [Dentipellis sp. KUC8613]